MPTFPDCTHEPRFCAANVHPTTQTHHRRTDHPPPTRHETAEELFNTQFQLSFSENKQIVIGRSRNCNMVLDYRTVSTQHATVTFRKGGFYFRDLSSSNGSMLNLRRPLKLPYNQWVRLRYGRSIVAFKAKRSWMRRKFSSMSMTAAAASLASAAAATAGGGGGGAGAAERGSNNSGSSSGGQRMSASRQLQLELDQLPHHPRRQGGGADSASSASDGASCASNASTGGGDLAGSTLRDQLDILDSLCRIDATPRLRPTLSGGSGGLLTPGGGRFYQSIAGESMSPSAISAALFQLHLQAASSRRGLGFEGDGLQRASGAFDPVLPIPGGEGMAMGMVGIGIGGDSFADAEGGGGDAVVAALSAEAGLAAAAESATTIASGGQAQPHQPPVPQQQQQRGRTKPPQEDVVGQGLRDAFPGVRFHPPADSPVAESQASQLST